MVAHDHPAARMMPHSMIPRAVIAVVRPARTRPDVAAIAGVTGTALIAMVDLHPSAAWLAAVLVSRMRPVLSARDAQAG